MTGSFAMAIEAIRPFLRDADSRLACDCESLRLTSFRSERQGSNFLSDMTAKQEPERRFGRIPGADISTPANRRLAKLHFHLADHGLLRILWTNLHPVASGVWRSNQPSPRRLARYRNMGIRTILNLRGERRSSFYLFEKEACAKLGLILIDQPIYARHLVPAERWLGLLESFDRIEKPFVMHCKSGADRSGIASALWLLDQEGASVEEARRQLSRKFVHLKSTKAGVQDHLVDIYEEDTRERPMPIRQWFAERYDPEAIQASFHAKMGWPAPDGA